MPNVVHLQTNFTAGELSPRLLGRVDLSKYNNGASKIENAVVQSHGGLSRRPGTRFCCELKNSSDSGEVNAVYSYTEDIDGVATTFPCYPRLVEFHYSSEQSYVLEIGVVSATLDTGTHGYIRVNRMVNNVPTQLKETGGGTPIVERASVPINAKELTQLKFTQSADTMYIFCPTRPILKLVRSGVDTDSDSWVITPLKWDTSGGGDGFIDGPYLSMNATDTYLSAKSPLNGVGEETEIKAYQKNTGTKRYPFVATDVGRSIRLEDAVRGHKITSFITGEDSTTPQSGSAALVTVEEVDFAIECGDGNPKIEFFNVTRGPTFLDGTLHQVYSCDEGDNSSIIGLGHGNTGELEAYESAKSYNTANDIDGFVRIKPSDFSGWGVIESVGDQDGSTGTYHKCVVRIKAKFVSAEKTPNWRLGAWSDTTGYPQNGGFHQNRLWCATTSTQPQSLWASEVNVYNVFSPNDLETAQVTDSTSLDLTLASRQVNTINHIKSDAQGLMVFTSGGEWLGRASNPSAPITSSDVGFSKQSSYGSIEGVEPVRLGTAYLLFQRDRATLREYTYQFGQDRFVAPNITLLSEHITKNGVVDATFQMGSTQRLWCVTSTGELLCLTYDKEQEVVAWTRGVMGSSGNTPSVGVVKSCARTTDGDDDNVWLLVERTIGSTTKRFIETVAQEFEATDAHAAAYFVDSGLSGYDGSGATIWTGLDHLNGESVYALVDGVQYGPVTVGSVTGGIGITTVSANNVQVGLLYKTTVETLPLNVQQSLESRGKRKRLFTSFLSMYRSLTGKAGTPDQLYDIEYPAATTSPPPLNTGLFEVSMPDNSDREMIVKYEQEDVHPSNLLGITSEIHLGSI